MYSTSEFRKGLKIEIDGDLLEMVDFQHHKPGKGSAIVRTKLKNLITGRILEKTFRSGDRVKKPDFQESKLQFLYQQDGVYFFMNNKSYEQVELSGEFLGDSKDFLQENLEVSGLFHDGKPITVELPNFVTLKIIETEPGVKGDTVQGGTKSAKMETGATVMVPLFMNEGDVLKIDTRTGQYVERVNK